MNNAQSFKNLESLWEIIEERALSSSPKDSYIAFLLSKGVKECSKFLNDCALFI